MVLSKVSTHVTQAVANLVEQYKGKPKMAATLEAFVQQVQDLEDALFELLNERDLDTAVGAQLDTLGDIVGEGRLGRNDVDYRIAIRGRILVNLSEGTPVDLIHLLEVLGEGSSVILTEYFPAALTAELVDAVADEDEAHRIGDQLHAATAAGVLSHLIYHGVPEAERFRFDTAGQGFDEGKYGGVY
jgi:hypothetical protein